jgi:hypothetical protein
LVAKKGSPAWGRRRVERVLECCRAVAWDELEEGAADSGGDEPREEAAVSRCDEPRPSVRQGGEAHGSAKE